MNHLPTLPPKDRHLRVRSIRPWSTRQLLLGALSLSLLLSACGDPVLNSQAVDVSQAAVAPGAELTPGSKGQQELSGKLLQRLYEQSASRPAAGELILTARASQREIRVQVPGDGGILLPELADGEYLVSATLSSGSLSYSESFAPISIVGGRPTRPLELVSNLVKLTGSIRLEGQERAAGARVSISGLQLSAQTDELGAFSFGEVPISLLQGRELEIHKANFATVSQPLGEISSVAKGLISPELKSVVPLSPTSVLERSAGQVVLARRQEPAAGPNPAREYEGPIGGFSDGPAAQARFQSPGAIALAPDGTLYLADTGNHAIRKISPTGQVSTLAGGQGYADGPLAQARFSSPTGLALDTAGNLYVADTGNHAIRKIGPTGQVSTLAGGQGYADGPLAQARFNLPTDLGLDAAGNLYVLDFANQALRKITPAGRVETVFHSQWRPRSLFETLFAGYLQQNVFALPLTEAQGPENDRLLVPRNLAVGADGTLYVSDAASFLIEKIPPGGSPEHFAGNSRLFESGATAARRDSISFNNPQALAVDAQGTVYLSDLGTVYRIPQAGPLLKLAGLPALSLGYQDQTRFVAENLFYPGGMALHPDGSLSVSDRRGHGVYTIWPCEASQGEACRQEPFYARNAGDTGPSPGFGRYGGGTLFVDILPALPQLTAKPADNPPAGGSQQMLMPDPYADPNLPAYLIKIENRSARLDLGPGLCMNAYTADESLFSEGQPDRGLGFEAFAEDGDLYALDRYYAVAHTDFGPLVLLTPDPGFRRQAGPAAPLAPGQSLEAIVFATRNLHFYFRLTGSNDRFLSFGPQGLPLRAADGSRIQGDVTDKLSLWDAGTEADEPFGSGAHQPGRQRFVNDGEDENGVVRQITDPALPPLKDLIRVTLTPLTGAEVSRRTPVVSPAAP